MSSGGSSRLLVDYPAQQRAQILDYLFKPDYGASLQMLKVEIGGDMNATDGAEPSHMRTPDQVDCNRGYEWWLMEQAKARNPAIKLYGLEWGAPGWVGNGQPTVWTPQNITYLLSWLGCARQHGLQINYLGGWNESGYNPSWFVALRSALDRHGYRNVKLVVADSYDWNDVGTSIQNDPAFKNAVGVIGEHYPCSSTGCAASNQAIASGKPIWDSEELAYGSTLAQSLNLNYIDGRITGGLIWALEWSAYSSLPYGGTGLAGMLDANTPWSGNYSLFESIWAAARTTQFAQPGWRYLNSGSFQLPAIDNNISDVTSGGSGVSVVSLRSPTGNDWSSIIETVGAHSAQQLNYRISGGLSTGTVHVWSTDLNSTDPTNSFEQVADIHPQNGQFTFTAQPGYVYSLTTTTGQHKGTAVAPPAAPWSLPYSDNFDEYPAGSSPRYMSDLSGAFETTSCAGRSGGCLEQVITQEPVRWLYGDQDVCTSWPWPCHSHPVTVIGSPDWTGYQVTVDARLQQAGSVELVGRASAPNNGLQGYHFRISDNGDWSVYRENSTGFNSNPVDTTLASGTAAFGVATWHQLGLILNGNQIQATLDGRILATVTDNTYQAGQIGLEVDNWINAQFDNLHVTAVGTGNQAPSPAPSSANGVQAPTRHEAPINGFGDRPAGR